jgi:hypothetical protein
MSETNTSQNNRTEMMAALFAHMVMQQTNLAMMLLGKILHPETGQTIRDLEGAKLFIDQLEMLEAKTKGNLSKQEEGLLKQNLMNLRLAFVEAVNEPSGDQPPAQPTPPPPSTSAEPQTAGASAAPAEESHKKFSKKY